MSNEIAEAISKRLETLSGGFENTDALPRIVLSDVIEWVQRNSKIVKDRSVGIDEREKALNDLDAIAVRIVTEIELFVQSETAISQRVYRDTYCLPVLYHSSKQRRDYLDRLCGEVELGADLPYPLPTIQNREEIYFDLIGFVMMIEGAKITWKSIKLGEENARLRLAAGECPESVAREESSHSDRGYFWFFDNLGKGVDIKILKAFISLPPLSASTVSKWIEAIRIAAELKTPNKIRLSEVRSKVAVEVDRRLMKRNSKLKSTRLAKFQSVPSPRKHTKRAVDTYTRMIEREQKPPSSSEWDLAWKTVLKKELISLIKSKKS